VEEPFPGLAVDRAGLPGHRAPTRRQHHTLRRVFFETKVCRSAFRLARPGSLRDARARQGNPHHRPWRALSSPIGYIHPSVASEGSGPHVLLSPQNGGGPRPSCNQALLVRSARFFHHQCGRRALPGRTLATVESLSLPPQCWGFLRTGPKCRLSAGASRAPL
jgi:hypothetical protein